MARTATQRTNVQVVLNGKIMGQSPKAIKFCSYDHDNKTEWFPLSQVYKISEKGSDQEDECGDKLDLLIVSEWIMKAKELI